MSLLSDNVVNNVGGGVRSWYSFRNYWLIKFIIIYVLKNEIFFKKLC